MTTCPDRVADGADGPALLLRPGDALPRTDDRRSAEQRLAQRCGTVIARVVTA
ncbi:hypothetical protein HUT18_17180 [Streptomyces sp. NA04227]|uniref:hypothetical protein n=1 Tax=Streptomyces sp. NA04227 TaxID=2742136 RepID=UPI001591EE0F|nr:hypothetical protein [Streptomyces sp. NA04227]QKW07862.1 hypothetical protein HUT18_17180 [Streptomyces sp. NA04227]